MCCKSTKLDIQALIDRLGPGHGSMHQDLVGLFVCSYCKAAGRDRRPVFFTFVPGDDAEPSDDGETVMWDEDLKSQGVLTSLA